MTESRLDDLSATIRTRRRQQRLTQEELAAAVGVSASYIAHIELGRRRPSVELLTRLSEELDAAELIAMRPTDDVTVKSAPGEAGPPVIPPAAVPTAEHLTEQTLVGSVVASAVAEVGAQGPTVLALLCERGHPNPLYATACRTCGEQLSGSAPIPVSRPALGTLRGDGVAVRLVRGAILGRAPDLTRDDLGELPQLVVIRDNPMVSRSHLQVSLDGWVVVARDLGSANGTILTLPGRPPERMSPTTYYVLTPGATLSLADEVVVVFESGPDEA